MQMIFTVLTQGIALLLIASTVGIIWFLSEVENCTQGFACFIQITLDKPMYTITTIITISITTFITSRIFLAKKTTETQ